VLLQKSGGTVDYGNDVLVIQLNIIGYQIQYNGEEVGSASLKKTKKG
jgi:hypothetical protein